MTFELMLSKIVVSIARNGYINNIICNDKNISMLINNNKIAIINALLISHKKHYMADFTDNAKSNEIVKLQQDYNSIFQSAEQIITNELLVALFIFIIEEKIRSVPFREAIVSLTENLTVCENQSVKFLVFTRIISLIIRGCLYGEEPYNSILERAVEFIDSCQCPPSELEQVMFLE